MTPSDLTYSTRETLGRNSLAGRLAMLASLFVVEILAISVWLDNDLLAGTSGLAALIHDWGATAVRVAVAFAFLMLIFGDSRRGDSRRASIPSVDIRVRPLSWPLCAAHFATISAFIALSGMLFANRTGAANWLAGIWIVVGFSSAAVAALALIPLSAWKLLFDRYRDSILFALGVGLAACLLGEFAWRLWPPLSRWTFFLVKEILSPVLPRLSADLANFSIGTPEFRVEISPQCSGYEGIGLMLALSAAWLWFLRREWRFPHILLLLPAGILVMFLLNSARIAALVLIGVAGAPAIAVGGFHSQAGWLTFNAAAVGLCLASRKIPWFVRNQEAPADRPHQADATTAYLAPLLAILVAAMVSRGVSGEFEWVYPLRVFVAAGAIWWFRGAYRKMDWRVGWPAAVAGVVVFALWIGLEPLTRSAAAPAALIEAGSVRRVLWIVLRVVGAVVTVPLAEEIAFRGFLMRRFQNSDFESVSSRQFSWAPFLLSSVAFGLLHGERWLAGIVAGMIYGLVMIRRGRIGEAVVAHAVTNALVAAWVLTTGNWQLW
jgi:exosortase E/protease (VPEID-CTERM system)